MRIVFRRLAKLDLEEAIDCCQDRETAEQR